MNNSKQVDYLVNDLSIIYNGLRNKGIYLEPFNEWVETIRFFHKTRTGGIVLNESMKETEKGQGIWYVNIFCPGSLPNRTEFKYIIATICMMGCKIIAAHTTDNRIMTLLRYFNFSDMDNGLFSIRCVLPTK